jgi:hypothetical protein
LLVKPLNPKYFMTPEQLEVEKRLAHEKAKASEVSASGGTMADTPSSPIVLVVAWLLVLIPLAWGIYRACITAAKFF